jgi:hypothetical protein
MASSFVLWCRSIQQTMKFEQVAKRFRQNVAPLSAGQIIDGDFAGRGRISAVDGKLELAVILDGDRPSSFKRRAVATEAFVGLGQVGQD